MNKLLAEALGTFFLVFIGVGTALFAASVAGVGVGLLGVALAFGLTVTAMAYVVGPISGCHLNPAVTVGLAVSGRFERKDVIGYVIAQVIGGALGAGALYLIAKGGTGLDAMVNSGFAANGFGEHSPAGFDRTAVIIAEILATAMFVFVIIGVTTDGRVPAGFAPLAIGLTLTLALMVTLMVSNGSINPARSTASAIIAKGWALEQLWVFWVAPIVGGVLGGVLHSRISQ